MAQRWRLTRADDGATVTYPGFSGWRWFEDGLVPPPVEGKGWLWVEDPPPPPPEPEAPTRWEVRKLLIIDRLIADGRFAAAMAALGGPGAVAYERWQAALTIDSDDVQVRGLLTAIGADPDAILAPES